MKTKILLSAFLLCSVLTSYGQWSNNNLSEPKYRQGVTTLGSKAYFAGGATESDLLSAVEIFDVTTGDWDTVINLSVPRSHPVCVAGGTKVFVAGGIDFETMTFYDDVDIWDTVTRQWTLEQLSIPRFSVGAVSHGNKILFAGGANLATGTVYDNVEIYDTETGTWSFSNLSMARCAFAWAVVGDLAIFAGGYDLTTVTDRVDIYNFTTNTWSTAALSLPRGFLTASAVGNKVLIAGGENPDNTPSDRVDIYDAETNTWEIGSLSVARAMLQENSASVCNKKAYFTGGGNIDLNTNNWTSVSDVIDIYDVSSGLWTTDHLSNGVIMHTAAGVGNYLIVAGGVLESFTLTSLVEIFHDPTLIHVPADYSTIQAGINAASDGDTVLVAENTYYENINFNGKAILVASEFILDGDTNHINNTIIDGSQPVDPDKGSVVTFESGEDTTSVLCGFTITRGTGTFVDVAGNARFGGGVVIFVSGAKLLNNHIENNIVTNEEWTSGGGVCAIAPLDTIPMPWVVLRGNRIIHNKVISNLDEGDGGGADIFYNLIMEDNEVSWNEAEGPYRGDGGGVRCRSDFGHTEVLIRNNNITHNKATSVSESTDIVLTGGLSIFWDCSGIISDNNVSFNEIEAGEDKGGYGTGILIDKNASEDVVLENNLIEGNTFTGGFLNGGGLCIYWSSVLVQNNILKDNTGTNGGGIYVETPDDLAVLINNTIVGNNGDNGGGLHATNANAVVINTIIWGNTATLDGTSIFEEGSTIEVRYSDVEGDAMWPGEGNVDIDPQFQSDGYHLDMTSLILNKGISTIIINGVSYDCPGYDFDGDLRPYANTLPDIGADETPWYSVSAGKTIKTENYRIYPNPAHQMVTISVNNSEAVKEISIYNHLGQNVYTGIPNDITLDISKLQPGMYIIELVTDQGNMREKLVVE